MSEAIIRALCTVLAETQIVPDVAADAPVLLQETRRRLQGVALAAVYPETTAEVAALLRLSRDLGFAVVPRGGGTSRNAAALPTDAKQVVLCLERLNRLREVNPVNASMTVEAGMILADAQRHAADAGLFFPLSLGSEDRCTVGGCIAHNAGGLNVLRYGNTRDQLLGLEYVLADGTVVNDLHSLRKNNTGYALNQLLAGSEGTLAVVTAAVFKLAPPEAQSHSVLLHLADMRSVVRALQLARQYFATLISSFEFMADICVQSARQQFPELRLPYCVEGGYHVLLRVAGCAALPLGADMLRPWLAALGVTHYQCSGEAYREDELWAWRYAIVSAEQSQGVVLKHDIAVPSDRLETFINRAAILVDEYVPGARPYPFGHVGDGNIHYNIFKPVGAADAFLAAYREPLGDALHELAVTLGGTYSAEHGIGLFKRGLLARYSEPAALQLMQQIKGLFDPDNRLNPDKLWEVKHGRDY